MKKTRVVTLIACTVLGISTLVGCQSSVETEAKTGIEKEKEKEGETEVKAGSEGEETVIVAERESSKDNKSPINGEVLEIVNDELKGEYEIHYIELTKLDDKYLLAEIKDENVAKDIEGRYYLIDYINKKTKYIELENNLGRVSHITYSDNKITFDFDGTNIITPHREFPYSKIYDVGTGEISKGEEYRGINYGVTVGNSVNELKIDSVTTKDFTINLTFDTTENTILAGGIFAADTQTGYIFDEKLFYIDFDNIVLTEDIKTQLDEIKGLPYVDEISYREYEDSHKDNHLVIYLKLNKIGTYQCNYSENEDSGLMDFNIEFQGDYFNYMNVKNGFIVQLPLKWMDKYVVIEEENNVTFAYSEYKYDDGSYQNFFSVAIVTKEEYEKLVNDPPMTGTPVLEDNGKVYLYYSPLEVSIENHEKLHEYIRLNGLMRQDEAKDRFRVLEIK